MKKQIPLQTEQTDTICGFCSVGCSVKTETCGTLAVKAVPDPEGPVNQGVLCKGVRVLFLCERREQTACPPGEGSLRRMRFGGKRELRRRGRNVFP